MARATYQQQRNPREEQVQTFPRIEYHQETTSPYIRLLTARKLPLEINFNLSKSSRIKK